MKFIITHSQTFQPIPATVASILTVALVEPVVFVDCGLVQGSVPVSGKLNEAESESLAFVSGLLPDAK